MTRHEPAAATDADREKKRRRRDRVLAELARDEWPTTGDAAAVLGVNRSTVQRMQAAGVIGWRNRPTAGQKPTRECNPADIREQLTLRGIVHRPNL